MPQVLSLSHNQLESLAGLPPSLEELNLNFNKLGSCDELRHCANLRKLYISNNGYACSNVV